MALDPFLLCITRPTFVLLLQATSPFHFMIHFHFIWPAMIPINEAILLLYLVTLDW